MSLEHRWGRRTPVQTNALIFHRPLGLVRGKVMDISLDGVLIDTGCITLPPHAVVNLTLGLEVAGKHRLFQMQAMVVHHSGNKRSANHHGLMFKDALLEEFRSAVQVLLKQAA